MLLFTLVYNNCREDIIEGIRNMKGYFKEKDVAFGFSESIENNTHFIKIYCDEEKFDNKLDNMFELYMANILYDIMIENFCKYEIHTFITSTYFFLKYDEIKEVKEIACREMKMNSKILNDDSVYLMNRKNSIVKKIQQCVEENKEMNVDGFLRFRTKEYIEDIQDIVDKIVEQYMSYKEYNEFINLLKYFVDIQESKIKEVNIIIDNDGNYIIKGENDEDISEKFFSEISDIKSSAEVTVEDMLISALITNVPEKIVIHCVENCNNKEILETIKKVFEDRVHFCNNCNLCRKYNQNT